VADRSVVIRLKGDIADFSAKMKQAGIEAEVVGTKAEASAKRHSQALQDIGTQAGKIGLVAAAGVAAVVTTTANFEQAMSKVAATGDDARANLDALRESAIQAGADTAFSASEAAAGIENLAKAGVSAKDTLGGGLDGALALAAAGELDVADAAEVAATAMTQFKLGGSSVPHIADLLAAAAGKAQGEVSDMAYALKQSGLVAAQMGLSIEETTGTLGAFASAGLLGSDAGTSLRTMLLRLANPSGEAAEVMKDLGIAAYDAKGNFVGITALSGQLSKAFKGQKQSTRDAALATIFGSDAIRAANVLYSQGAKGIEGWIKKVDDSGFAAETAATKLDNLKGDFEKLTGSIETLFITSGDDSQNFFRSMVQGADDAVNALNGMPDPLKDVALGVLAITAVTGGGLWFGSRTIQAVANTKKSLAELGVQAKITRGAMLKAGAVVAGFAIANSDLAQKTGLSNTASLALMGTVAGPWGAAIGGAIGLTKDLAAANNDLEAAIHGANDATADQGVEALLTARAKLVEEFTNLTNKEGAGGVFSRFGTFLSGGVGDFENALANLDAEIKLARNSADGIGPIMAQTMGLSARSTDLATASAEDFADAIDRINGLLSKRASVRDYEASIDELTQSIKDNGKTLDINTEKGRANGEALDNIANTALKVAESLAPGAARQNFLSEARKDFLKAADALDINNARARKLADKFGLLEKEAEGAGNAVEGVGKKHAEPKVKLTSPDGGDPFDLLTKYGDMIDGVSRKRAQARVDILSSAGRDPFDLLALYGDKLTQLNGRTVTTYIDTVQRTRRLTEQTGPQVATGGLMSGPGTKTSDSIPAWLSTGEYVVKAAAVDHYGADFFHRANMMRLASGGLASRDQSYSSRRSGADWAPRGPQTMQVWGELDTPWGPATVRGVAREEARGMAADSAALDRTHDRMYRGKDRG